MEKPRFSVLIHSQALDNFSPHSLQVDGKVRKETDPDFGPFLLYASEGMSEKPFQQDEQIQASQFGDEILLLFYTGEVDSAGRKSPIIALVKCPGNDPLEKWSQNVIDDLRSFQKIEGRVISDDLLVKIENVLKKGVARRNRLSRFLSHWRSLGKRPKCLFIAVVLILALVVITNFGMCSGKRKNQESSAVTRN